MIGKRWLDAELDMTLDEQGWVKENPVYCPIPWCSAHKLRTVRCGDVDGDYEGIHAARIKYVATFMKNERQRVRFFERLGSENPVLEAAMSRTIQDSVDMGLVPGRKGRRR